MMTRKIRLRGVVCALLLCGLFGLADRAGAALSYSWTGSQDLRDNDPDGWARSFDLSDPMMTTITRVSVTLDVSGGWNGDLYAYLSFGSGYAVLLNRVGLSAGNQTGYANPGFAVTLRSDASADIHLYQTQPPSYNSSGQLTGIWAADGRYLDPDSGGSAFDAAARNNTLSAFNGLNPNGTWTFFIADRSGGEIPTLNGWSVTVEAVPEPGSLALLCIGALTLGGASFRRRWRQRRRRS